MERIGIDFGGSKIEIAVLDAAGTEALRRRVATPAGDYAATIDAIARLVADAERERGARCSVGVATPGSLSLANGLMRNANSTTLNGHAFKEDLEARLGREVRLANDANCFALSEAVDGSARGASVVFGVILGTGVGGGIVVDGRVLTGSERDRRRVGTQSAARDSRRGPALAALLLRSRRMHRDLSFGPGALGRPRARHGRSVGRRRNRAAGGSRGRPCEASVGRYEARLARSLAAVINVLDPEVIVLGGGLSNLARLYETRAGSLGGPCLFGRGAHAPRAAGAR